MKHFECSGGMKISQSYNIHKSGFDIVYDKNGKPWFICKDCGKRYNIDALNKKFKQIKD